MTNPRIFHRNVQSDFPDHLRDESRRIGKADSLSFPLSEPELRADLAAAFEMGVPVTLQGGRTGITAGAVPAGGHVLSTHRMSRLLRMEQDGGEPVLTVEAGLLLSDLRRALASGDVPPMTATSATADADSPAARSPLFFPPDPTETSASIGGMIACNASGACSYLYGATRRFVKHLRVALADGDALSLHRGKECAAGRTFHLVTEGGRKIEGRLPDYRLPQVKNASGYFVEDGMDLLDLFVGSEGTLGVITEAGLRLLPQPPVIWGLMAFLPSNEAAAQLVRHVRAAPTHPAAIEFFDADALEMLRAHRAEGGTMKDLPELPQGRHTAVYVEYHLDDESAAESAVETLSDFLPAAGGDVDRTWLVTDPREVQRLKDFRHAVPECVNRLIDERRKQEPGLTKLGTDLSVPDTELEAVIDLYRSGIAETGIQSVIFGHIGNNHVHVNLIPRNMEEYARGKALYLKWAEWVVARGGSVSGEHGIGKLKRDMLRMMYSDAGIRAMQDVKRAFDPLGRLNPGNLFE
jgi:D-lactate dehydrogenase (cytochrome)